MAVARERQCPGARERNVPAKGSTHWPILEAAQRLTETGATELKNRMTYKELTAAAKKSKKTVIDRARDLVGAGFLELAKPPRREAGKTLRLRVTEAGKQIESAESLERAIKISRGELCDD